MDAEVASINPRVYEEFVHYYISGIAAILRGNKLAGAKDWLKNNPKKAAFFAITGSVVAVPALVTAPLLGGLGFTALGPAAGSIAAGAQAAGGTVAAGGLFATLQSAAMGGYGVAAVNGVIQGGAALGAGAKLYHDKTSHKTQ